MDTNLPVAVLRKDMKTYTLKKKAPGLSEIGLYFYQEEAKNFSEQND